MVRGNPRSLGRRIVAVVLFGALALGIPLASVAHDHPDPADSSCATCEISRASGAVPESFAPLLPHLDAESVHAGEDRRVRSARVPGSGAARAPPA